MFIKWNKSIIFMNGLIRIQAKFFILEKDVILNIVQNVNQEGRNNLLANVQRLSKAHKEPYNRFFFCGSE